MANNLSNTETAVALLAGQTVYLMRSGRFDRANEYINALNCIVDGFTVESNEPVEQLTNALSAAFAVVAK